ncbi:MAG: hypothetical protein DI596_13800 [Azospira oryzae]|nr:MAG: hypothetical protein DI596_13800 [Azospira oryzae]PZP76757.1 MAG: hypothetical protein DI593_13800 [Azospira oryzae]
MSGNDSALERRLEALEARVRHLERLVAQQYAGKPPLTGTGRLPDGGAEGGRGPRASSGGQQPTAGAAPGERRTMAGGRWSEVKAAVEQFPHVVQNLILTWGHPECEAYLAKLIIDERGSRRGFPLEAMDELLFMSELLRFRHPEARPQDRRGTAGDVWAEPVSGCRSRHLS